MSASAETFERCMAVGGVAVFPADTVYGLACDPGNRFAVERLYLLKRRALEKPSAVMFFDLDHAFMALPELGDRTRRAMAELLPGGVTFLVPNPAGHFPLACGADPSALGVRVPDVQTLAGVAMPALQSSANLAGGPDPTRVQDIPESIRVGVDLVIDAGPLPGTPSTVVDVREYDETGEWTVIREGAVPSARIGAALAWQYHFDPDTYLDMIRSDVPLYDTFQDELVRASGEGARRILELGTGTGETARRLLEHHPQASLVGIDVSGEMLEVARAALGERADLRVGRLEEPLPSGRFDLVASALCVHHLEGASKADLFRRVAEALAPGGRFVLADIVEPLDESVPRTPWTPGYDFPSPLADQLAWLREAGLAPAVTWSADDLAVVVATRDGGDMFAR
jgi:tRNA threonylcarbamoyl adenosine modification protein (Sua5/YciO/YrdC/YwlC family)